MSLDRPSVRRRSALKWATTATALVWAALCVAFAASRCEPDERSSASESSRSEQETASSAQDATVASSAETTTSTPDVAVPAPPLSEEPDGRFTGSICGLCPSDLWKNDSPSPREQTAATDDWDVLLAHPFTVREPESALGKKPGDLRTAFKFEVPMASLPKHRDLVAKFWRAQLNPRWLDERRVDLQRAVRIPDPQYPNLPDDYVIAAWHREGRWLQLLRREAAFAIRTSFEPRCGMRPAEQTAAALALAGELLRDLPPNLCQREWGGGAASATYVDAGLPYLYRNLWEWREWPLTAKIRIQGDKVLLTFAIPREELPPSERKRPWFARRRPNDDGIEDTPRPP
jgi:hypothetical protein